MKQNCVQNTRIVHEYSGSHVGVWEEERRGRDQEVSMRDKPS